MKTDRLHQMKDYFLSNKTVTNQELCDVFNISIETVRRDLSVLEGEGIIRRVYGGAKLAYDNSMPEALLSWAVRMKEHHDEKVAIAQEMIKRIPNNATIALDSGTTIFEVAKLLSQKQNLTIITNCIHQAVEISQSTDHLLYFIGGAIKKDELITTGFLASDFLRNFSQIDMAIICSDGIDAESGVTEYSVEMGQLKQQMIQMAKKTYYLGDYNTFGAKALFRCCPLEDIDTIITDDKLSHEYIAAIRKRNIELVLAKTKS